MERLAVACLNEEILLAATNELGSRDADLAGIVERFGPPPLWARPPGFSTLVQIMLEQQVSLASAFAAFDRLRAAVDPLTPDGFLGLNDRELLVIGFSHQKARYVRGLARALTTRSFDLDRLATLPDEEVHRELVALIGVGPWTASIYMMEALLRPDVWPVADMALVASVAQVKGLDRRPGPTEMEAIGQAWRPWRSVAARLFWHDYLGRRGRPPTAPEVAPDPGIEAATNSTPARGTMT
jgi:DNA-3-methyladenine glycosylase II